MFERSSEPIIPSLTEDALLVEFRRVAANERGEPLTWGATPLVLSPDVVLQQNYTKNQIEELFEDSHVPVYVSKNLAEYIEVLNMSRTYNREDRNRNSFVYRGKTDLDGVPIEVLDVLDGAIKGFASPAELLLIARVLEIPTIELASLTHPYGQRIDEHLDPMRRAVDEAVDLLGGQKMKDPLCAYEVKGSDNPHDPSSMEGIHMTRKRIVGVLPDGTEIMERSSFVLLIDNLPPHVAAKIRSIKYDASWSDAVLNAANLHVLIPLFLEKNMYETAIPISTTVVAINPKLEERLLSKEAMRARSRQYVDSHKSMI
jgi:hypothetical protein